MLHDARDAMDEMMDCGMGGMMGMDACHDDLDRADAAGFGHHAFDWDGCDVEACHAVEEDHQHAMGELMDRMEGYAAEWEDDEGCGMMGGQGGGMM